MLVSLFDFIRDLAIIAAALGIARWTWDWHSSATAKRDDAAAAALANERHSVEVRQILTRLDENAAAMVAQLGEAGERHRRGEERSAGKVRIHHLLQSTSEPFMTFGEIEQALGGGETHDADAIPGEVPSKQHGMLAGDCLRQVLIELVSDGVIAQLDRDRYFIASDYETGSEDTGGSA